MHILSEHDTILWDRVLVQTLILPHLSPSLEILRMLFLLRTPRRPAGGVAEILKLVRGPVLATAANKRPNGSHAGSDQDQPHLRHAPNHQRCDLVSRIVRSIQISKLHGFDDGADRCEESEAQERAERDLELSADL